MVTYGKTLWVDLYDGTDETIEALFEIWRRKAGRAKLNVVEFMLANEYVRGTCSKYSNNLSVAGAFNIVLNSDLDVVLEAIEDKNVEDVNIINPPRSFFNNRPTYMLVCNNKSELYDSINRLYLADVLILTTTETLILVHRAGEIRNKRENNSGN